MAQISVTLDRGDPPVGVVVLLGDHDVASSRRLENELAVLLDDGVGVVVDLRETTFIDSQTLSVLLSARHQAEEAALGFALALPDDDSTQVNRLLGQTGLGDAFAASTSLDRARTAAHAGAAAGGRGIHIR
jgi:anti-anti-sigma factor